MSDLNIHYNTEAIVLIAVSTVTLLAAFIVCLLRYLVEPSALRRLAFLDCLTVGMAWILSLIAAICAINGTFPDAMEDPARKIDSYTQSLLTVSGILGKLSICFSAWHIVSIVPIVQIFMSLQVFMLILAYPLFVIVMPATCSRMDNPFPLFASFRYCENSGVKTAFEWCRILFEIFTPLFLTAFPIILARNNSEENIMKKSFKWLAVASAIASSLMCSRVWMSQWFRFDNKYVPEIVITVVSMVEANIGILAANILPLGANRAKLSTWTPRQRLVARTTRGTRFTNKDFEWVPLRRMSPAYRPGRHIC
ncbi:hypothetical protein F5Y11DRAFT_324193 [Daldinia sp. FL1419]|nr:hypothetical protein F5Y11DRAFT_324193 [Daldinia sp. FL1419]